MEDTWKEVGVVLAAILIGFGREVKAYFKKRKTVDMFSDGLDYDVLINTELDKLKYTYGFNRVAIVEFHNGLESYDGDSFNFMSMSHERTNNADSIIREFQRIPVTPVAEWLSGFDKNPLGYAYVKEGDGGIGLMYDAFGAVETYVFKLGDRISNGVLMCAYVHQVGVLDDEAIMDCKASAYKIRLGLEKKKKL